MITPTFSLTQDNDSVILSAKCPLIRTQDIEYAIEGRTFYFYAKPYYLRLCFQDDLHPGSIVSLENSELETKDISCQYEIEAGMLTFHLPKAIPGEKFRDLDLFTKLIIPSNQPTSKQDYTVNDSITKTTSLVQEQEGSMDLEERDDEELMFFDQVPIQKYSDNLIEDPQTSNTISVLNNSTMYGFNDSYTGKFLAYPRDYCLEILDFDNPESLSMDERKSAQEEKEREDFSSEHYMYDYLDTDHVIDNLLKIACLPPGVSDSTGQADIVWSETESKQLISLKKHRSFLFSNPKVIYVGLIDLLLSYCYNRRTTEMENTVESAWTISKLSSMLSWLVSRDSLVDTVRHFYIRVLCYPLYRNYKLADQIRKDVVTLIRSGKSVILRALLEIKYLLDHHECKYILSILYINDYCIWIQEASSKRLEFLACALEQLALEKDAIFSNTFDLSSAPILLGKLEREALSNDMNS
jgi:protein SHQ1